MFSNKTCYTCLKTDNKELVDLYKDDTDKIAYVDKLNACITKKLQITASMELCWPCVKQLQICYQFIEMVNNTQESLRRLYAAEQDEELKVEKSNLEQHNDEEIKTEAEAVVAYNSDSSDYILADLRSDELSCLQCSKTFADATEYSEHVCESAADDNNEMIEIDKAIIEIKCNDNEAEKTTKKVKKRPAKYNTKKSKPEINYICEQCGVNFNKRWKLQKHLARVHVEDKKYVCTYCNRGFKQSFHLREHITIHTGEKNYSCSICNKTFQRISSRHRHIRSHDAVPGQKTKRTPFLCNICGKSFPFTNGLQRHMRIHLGVKPHECNLCKRRFTQSTHLHVHMRTHTGEKPYICDTCGEAFSLNASLRKHLALHQKEGKNFIEDFSRMFLKQDVV